jgi:hypothetical protein
LYAFPKPSPSKRRLLMSVSMRPNRARPLETARSTVFRSVMSPGTTRIWSSLVGLIDRGRRDHPAIAIAICIDKGSANALR